MINNFKQPEETTMLNDEGRIVKVLIKDAFIFWTNFDGHVDNVGNSDLQFNVAISPALGEKLLSEGWPVKISDPSEEGGPNRYRMKVKISDKFFPLIYLITDNHKTKLNSKTVASLQGAHLTNIHLALTKFDGIRRGSGIPFTSVYLKTMYTELRPAADEFADEFFNLGIDDMPTND